MNFVPLPKEVIYYTLLIGIVSDISNGHIHIDNPKLIPNILDYPKSEARTAQNHKSLKQSKYHPQKEKEFIPYTYVIEVEHKYNDETLPNIAGNSKRETSAGGVYSSHQESTPERSTITPRLISEDINKKVEVFVEEGHDKSSYDHKEYDKSDEKWNDFDVHERKVKNKVVDMERGVYPREKEYSVNNYPYTTTPLPVSHRRMPSIVQYENANEYDIHKSDTSTGSSQDAHHSYLSHPSNGPKSYDHMPAQISYSPQSFSGKNKNLNKKPMLSSLTNYVPSTMQDSLITESLNSQLPHNNPKSFVSPYRPNSVSTYLGTMQPTRDDTRNHFALLKRNKPSHKNNKQRFRQPPKIMTQSPQYLEVLVPFVHQSSRSNHYYSKPSFKYKSPNIRNKALRYQLTEQQRNKPIKKLKANDELYYQKKNRRPPKMLPPHIKGKQISFASELPSNSKKYKLISSSRPAKPPKHRHNRRRVPSLGYALKEYWRLNTPSRKSHSRKIPKRNHYNQNIKYLPKSLLHEKRLESFYVEDTSLKPKSLKRKKNNKLSNHNQQNLNPKQLKFSETRNSFLDSNTLQKHSPLFFFHKKKKHQATNSEGGPAMILENKVEKDNKGKLKYKSFGHSTAARKPMMSSDLNKSANTEDSSNEIQEGNQVGSNNSGFNMELFNRKPCWSSKPLTAEINFSNFKPTSGTPKWYTNENTTPGPLKGQVDVLREQFYEPLLKEALCL